MFRILCLALALSSCISDHQEDTLDIPLSPSREDLPKSTASQLVAVSKEDLNPEKVMAWQHFFKPDPDQRKRQQITKKISNSEKKPDLKLDEVLELARNQKSIGQLVKAETRYREVLRRHPEHLDALIELAQIYLLRSQVEKSFDYIVAAKRILADQEKPKKIDLFKYKYTLSLGLLQSHRKDEGHRILSELISDDPKFTHAYIALAGSYLEDHKLDMTEFIAKRGLDHLEDQPELLNILGIVASQRGQYRKAQSYYNQALEKSPHLVSALVNRANLSINKGQYKSAEIDLRNAIKHNPYHTNAYISQGILFKKMGRYTSAKVSLQTALDQNPENAFARYNLAVLMVDKFDDKNTALRLFYEVLQSNEQTAEIKELAKVQIQGLRDSRLSMESKNM
ncbi:tetratricopeptide repeat protein [Pseudobacteriovorax antillogorgiicola]|uniref:Tetratricopeptide repeat-containing protein n=1 Tax=Pseudobacteriovorax antillogorgiicola TaxID=1513793 RepID=A0A1Y6CKH3_9BACT|nr:tetratricopeptide repeat protein [Pseudobacteriovorax antillogorgiicola]TCS45649.1 tetratricopeptide repeat protein [Pseudobacteriovorax antillogorgiicola]SMF72864.1 Tetratricopeptide repeat-containing protein [Pseudobacteriovorax antillogorgiicola]